MTVLRNLILFLFFIIVEYLLLLLAFWGVKLIFGQLELFSYYPESKDRYMRLFDSPSNLERIFLRLADILFGFILAIVSGIMFGVWIIWMFTIFQ